MNALRICTRNTRLVPQINRVSQSRKLILNQPFKIAQRRFSGAHYDWDHPAPGYKLKEWRRFAVFWVYGPYFYGFFGGCWMIYRLYKMRDTHFLHGVILWTELYW
eukprot:300545_1